MYEWVGLRIKCLGRTRSSDVSLFFQPFIFSHCQGQYLTVEQLTLDFEYVINEVIRNDASWSRQFCSFSDYDIVILEVGTWWVCAQTASICSRAGQVVYYLTLRRACCLSSLAACKFSLLRFKK